MPKVVTKRKFRGKGKYIPKKKVCVFCVNKDQLIDYKDLGLLRRFISDRGRIEPRRKTGVCARHQRVLSIALKRARHIALLPYTSEHIRQTGFMSAKEIAHRERPPREPVAKEPPPQETSTTEQPE